MSETQATVAQWADNLFGSATKAQALARVDSCYNDLRAAVVAGKSNVVLSYYMARFIIWFMRAASVMGLDIIQAMTNEMTRYRQIQHTNNGDGSGDPIN